MLTLPKSLKVGYHALLTPKLGGIPRRYCSSGLEAAKKRSKVLRKLLKQCVPCNSFDLVLLEQILM